MRPTSLVSLAAVALLLGCAGPSDDDDVTADDDDATADDDDATSDDDDATADDPDCEEPEPAPVDLSDGEEFIQLGFGFVELRLLGEMYQFGMLDADTNCPSWTGDHPSNDSGAIDWIGGCTTKDGRATFEGELHQEWGPGEPGIRTSVSTSKGWSVESDGTFFTSLEFEGSWTASETRKDDDVVYRSDEAEGFFRLVSTYPGYLDGTRFPYGLRGSYDWTGSWPEGPEVHTFEASAQVVCRSAVLSSIEIVQTPGVCFNPIPDGGTLTVESEGQLAALDFSDSADCSGCWPWSLDGSDQASSVCAQGF